MGISTEGWRCAISEDNSIATLLLNPPTEGNPYSLDDVLGFLNHNGVISGLIYSEIEKMLQTGIYYKEVVVARGTEPVDGAGGYYDFIFDKGQLKHPVIRSDGSVDYQSMNVIHSVKKDEILAIYHHAVPGTHGMDVKGRERRCKPGKELPELRGSGFVVEDGGKDTVIYKSVLEGRVEYDNYKLYVRDIYEFKGDLDLITGRIDFLGDVVIHGNVRAGTLIRSSKSITVEGNVEAAVIIAEGDIVLKKGMQGGQKAKLISGGNIYAYFLEYTDVEAKGNVEANIIMNSHVKAGKSIIVKGKKGYIVGGTFRATDSIFSTNIGNKAQVRTITATGVSKEVIERYEMLRTKYENTGKSMEKIRQTITELSDARISNEPKNVRDAKINQQKRRLMRDTRLLEHIRKELDELGAGMEAGKEPTIGVEGTAFAGLVVRIDDRELSLDSDRTHVEFYRPSPRDDVNIREYKGKL